jgi:hypothetical protein
MPSNRRRCGVQDTGDRYDYKLVDGAGLVPVIFARGTRRGLVYHELPNRGLGAINFFTGAISGFGGTHFFISSVCRVRP